MSHPRFVLILTVLSLCVATGCVNPEAWTCDDPELIDGSGVFEGWTSDRPQNHTGSCGGSGPEQVYQLDLAVESLVELNTDGSDFDTVLHVRSGDCNDESAQVDCDDDSGSGYQSYLELTLPAGTHYVFVDSYSTGAGYTLDVYVTPL